MLAIRSYLILREGIDFGGEYEIALGKAVDGVGPDADFYAAVGYGFYTANKYM